MPSIPAICDRCGAIFDPHAIALGPEARVTMSDNKAGPCPVCGGMGTIPDGVYSTVGGTITAVLSANYPMDTLDLVVAALFEGAEGRRDVDAIAEELEAEAPAAAAALRKLLVPTTPGEVAAYLGLIATAIVLARGTSSSATLPPSQIEEIVQQAVTQAIEATERKAPKNVHLPTLRERHFSPRPGDAGRKPKKPKPHGRRDR